MNNQFAKLPDEVRSLVAMVQRAALEECAEGQCPISPVLQQRTEQAIVQFRFSRVRTFVPLLALRQVRDCIRVGACPGLIDSPIQERHRSAMTTLTASGKPKRTAASMRVERDYRNVLTLFLSGQMPNFSHQRHVDVANVLMNIPYGRELMHLGLQTMTYRQFVVGKYSAEITDTYWDQLDGKLPDVAVFSDLPGGASGGPGVNHV